MSLSLYKVYQDENGEDLILYIDNEKVYSQESIAPGYISLEEIEKVIRSPIMKRYTKVYLLHDDETVAKDITEWVQSTGSIEKNNESGQCRSTNLTFANPLVYKNIIDRYEGYGTRSSVPEVRFNPMLMYDDFQSNVKIKIVTGVEFFGNIYEVDQGIFVVFDPKMSESTANSSLTIQLYDKFALLDGTISGDGEFEYEVPANTLIYDAIKQLILLPKNKRGEPFDTKEIIFPAKYRNARLAYTVKKTGENAIGELIKEICKSISCDVKYNAFGNLTISDTLEDLDVHYRQVSWNFQENSSEYQNPNVDIKRSQIKNRVVVVGANINGFLCKGIAENTDPNSLYSIYGPFGTRSVKIEDNLIPSNTMCEERARYELQKSMRKYITLSFQCTWIPHLEPGDVVRWTKSDWHIDNEEFVVNSISLPTNGTDLMSISMTNLKEISR